MRYLLLIVFNDESEEATWFDDVNDFHSYIAHMKEGDDHENIATMHAWSVPQRYLAKVEVK